MDITVYSDTDKGCGVTASGIQTLIKGCGDTDCGICNLTQDAVVLQVAFRVTKHAELLSYCGMQTLITCAVIRKTAFGLWQWLRWYLQRHADSDKGCGHTESGIQNLTNTAAVLAAAFTRNRKTA